RLNTFRGGEDCPCGWRKADLECDRHPDDRDRLGQALRRTNSGHARFDWIISLVYPEICLARSACGGGNTPRCACLYRADQEQRSNFTGILSVTPGFSQGFDNATKPLKRLNPVSVRNTGLKSGVTETVRNYMSMVREVKCDMFQSA